MKECELIDYRELILAGDINYLRFVDKNSNRLYLVEYYTDIPLETTIENISKLNNMDDVKKYFKDANIFEFIETRELKSHLNTIKAMTTDEKKMLTGIVKEIKGLNISYINFENFFVETQDRKLYYAKMSKKTKEVKLKNLKIDITITPADINTIIRDIKSYGAFKYHNQTIKYEDIKEYIDNPLIKPKKELSWVIDNIREYENTKKVQEKIKQENASKKREIKKEEETRPLDRLNELESLKEPDKDKKKDKKDSKKKKKNKENKEKKFKGSLAMYCLIGFTAGVLLAAITIVIGSFI